jgi:hypothetical protein
MAEDPESIARRLLQLRRLSKQLALTPDAEATYRALEQAKNAGAAPQCVQYLTDRLAFEMGNADQPPELPSESKLPRSKSTNPPALTEAKLESPPAFSLAQSVEAKQSEPFPPTLQLFESESDPFLGLDAQSPALANSLFVCEEQSESEESSEGQHEEQQPQAQPLLDRLPPEIRDRLTDEERNIVRHLGEIWPLDDGNPKRRRTETLSQFDRRRVSFSTSVYERALRKMEPFWDET